MEQLAGYLLDAPRGVIYDGLSPTEAAILRWHNLWADPRSAAWLPHFMWNNDRSAPKSTRRSGALYDRGLVFTTPLGTLAVPAVPGLTAAAGPALMHAGEPLRQPVSA